MIMSKSLIPWNEQGNSIRFIIRSSHKFLQKSSVYINYIIQDGAAKGREGADLQNLIINVSDFIKSFITYKQFKKSLSIQTFN